MLPVRIITMSPRKIIAHTYHTVCVILYALKRLIRRQKLPHTPLENTLAISYVKH